MGPHAFKTNLLLRISRLRLQAGDILVVRDPNVMEMLSVTKWPEHVKNLRTPIVFAPSGIEQLSFELLEQAYLEAKKSKEAA